MLPCTLCKNATDDPQHLCVMCRAVHDVYGATVPVPNTYRAHRQNALNMLNHMRRSTGINHNLVFTHNNPDYRTAAPAFLAEDWDHMLMFIQDFINTLPK